MRSSRLPLSCLMLLLAAPLAQAGGGDADAGDVSVITAEEIAREKPARISDMLKSRVGLDERYGIITMRGVEGVAVFVDGFSSSLGGLGSVKPEQVEKIEVLRGAASARFGAQAMGGAIAITTKKTVAAPLAGTVALGADSRGSAWSRVHASLGRDGLSVAMLLEAKNRHGFLVTPDSPMPYQISVANERSKTRLADVTLGWRNARAELSLKLKHEDDWAELGRPNWYFSTHSHSLLLKSLWRLDERWTLDAAVGTVRSRSPGVRDHGTGIGAAGLAAAFWLDEDSRNREGTLGISHRGQQWHTQWGASWADERTSSSSRDALTGQDSNLTDWHIRKQALFVTLQGPLGKGRLEAALRQDWQRYLSFHTESAGPPAQGSHGGGAVTTALSPKVALTWPLKAPPGMDCKLRASVGAGFAPPSPFFLYHRYDSASSVSLPNPDLRAERSYTADLGLSGKDAARQWSLVLFATRWQDKIANRMLDYGVPTVHQAQNVGVATAHGLEAQWAQRLARGWSLNANYTYSRTRVARDLAAPQLVGKALPEMPRHKANLALAYEAGAHFSARANVRAVGSAFTDEANTVRDARGYRWKKAAYAVLDVAATWRQPDWEFTLALDNALNRDYVQGLFWHGTPRTLRAEWSLRF